MLQKLITNYENHVPIDLKKIQKTPILSLAQHWLPKDGKQNVQAINQ